MTSAGSSPRAYAPASDLVASQTERRGKFEQVVVQELEIVGRYAVGALDAFTVQRPEL